MLVELKDKRGKWIMSGFTLPIDIVEKEQLKEIIKKWRADAIRDSDGTKLSEDILELGLKVYKTYLTTRNDQEWAMAHHEDLQQLYMMSEPVIAFKKCLGIDIMKGIFREQFQVNPKDYHWSNFKLIQKIIIIIGKLLIGPQVKKLDMSDGIMIMKQDS